MTGQAGAATGEAMAAVIADYAAFVDPLALAPSEIRDEAELPHPKARIVDALTAACSLAADAPNTGCAPSKLRGWLLLLAQFQPGVGAPILDPAAEVARRMTDARARGERIDAAALSDRIAEDAAEGAWSLRRTTFAPKVERERTRLLALL